MAQETKTVAAEGRLERATRPMTASTRKSAASTMPSGPLASPYFPDAWPSFSFKGRGFRPAVEGWESGAAAGAVFLAALESVESGFAVRTIRGFLLAGVSRMNFRWDREEKDYKPAREKAVRACCFAPLRSPGNERVARQECRLRLRSESLLW